MRLLLVEDDDSLRIPLKSDLEKAGFAVDEAVSGNEAEYLGDEGIYDLIVLDLGLPGKPGLEVLKHWRRAGNTAPVVILTARDEWQERVMGFKAGADDYVGKPFHIEELLARIRAVINRSAKKPGEALTEMGFVLDEDSQSVVDAKGTRHLLTGTEFRLLRYMMLNRGRVLSKSQLTEHVYDFDSDKDSNVIEVYVNRLRGKLGKSIIKTYRGQGYVFGERT